VFVAGLLVGCAGLLTGCQETPTEAAPSALSVTVSVPLERETAEYEDFTGATEAVESVEIRARVTGYLTKVWFTEGTEVKKGDRLFEIDPRPFQAKYERERAQIEVRQADVKFREAELARAKGLLPKNAISQSDYDRAVAAHEQAAASLAEARAAAAEAKLDLDFTELFSPITGEISRARVTPGNLVNADQTPLTSVVSLDPMYVYFDADERTVLDFAKAVREGRVKVHEGQRSLVWMGLANEEGFPHQGVLEFAENRFDTTTGTIRLRGVFQNPQLSVGGRMLMPGLFVRVRVPLGEPYQALMIAERAIGTDQGQKYVLVVNEKNEVESRRVTLGRLEGRLRVIEKGLRPGERVIVSGQQRARPGATVVPKLVSMETFAGPQVPAAEPARSPAASQEKPEKPQRGEAE
jgi:RND family efflux transporter MFP subunit